MHDINGLNLLSDADPARKLAALRSEMIMPISTIHGFAAMFRKELTAPDLNESREEFALWIEEIAQASNRLLTVLEALTKP